MLTIENQFLFASPKEANKQWLKIQSFFALQLNSSRAASVSSPSRRSTSWTNTSRCTPSKSSSMTQRWKLDKHFLKISAKGILKGEETLSNFKSLLKPHFPITYETYFFSFQQAPLLRNSLTVKLEENFGSNS